MDIFQRHCGMVCGHVESPFVAFDLDSGCLPWHDEASNTISLAVLATRSREDEAMRGFVHSCLPHLAAVDDVAAVSLFDSFSGHESGIAAMARLSQTECDANPSLQPSFDELLLLLLCAEVLDHDHVWEVAYYGVLVLQVVEET